MQSGAVAARLDAAARLFHRRDPPPALGEPRRRGAVHRRPVDPRHRRSRAADRRGPGAARRARGLRPRPAHLPRTGRADRPRELRPGRRGELAPGARRHPGAARHRRLAPGRRALDRRELGPHRRRGRRGGRRRPLPRLRRRQLGPDARRQRPAAGRPGSRRHVGRRRRGLRRGRRPRRRGGAGPTARSRRSRAASWRWTPRPAASSPCRAASPTSRASSTAPPRRCASPARRSSPSSTPRRSTAATARRRSCSTRRSRWRPRAGIWAPENSGGKYYGPAPIRTGLEQSRNLMTVRIAQDVGMDDRRRVCRALRRLRRHAAAPQLLARRRRDHALQDGHRLREIANGGLRVEPTLVDRVQDRYGQTIYRHDQRACEGCAADDVADASQPMIHSNAERIMDPITAYQITSMLQGAVSRGTSAELGRQARPQPRRQDRHHQRGQGRLVHRLLAPHRRRLLHGLRHPAPARRERLRRHALRADLRRVHQGGDGGAGAGEVGGAAGRPLHQDRPRTPASGCPTSPRAPTCRPSTSATARSSWSAATARPSTAAGRWAPTCRSTRACELAADRAGHRARPEPGAAEQAVARLDVERRPLLTRPNRRNACHGSHRLAG